MVLRRRPRTWVTIAVALLISGLRSFPTSAQEPPVETSPVSTPGDLAVAPSSKADGETSGVPSDDLVPVVAKTSPAATGADTAQTASEPPPIHGRRLIFYRDVDYGSESIFNPATVVISVGLGWYGLLGQNPVVQRIGSDGATGRLLNAYVHPIHSINERGGFRQFLADEFLRPLLLPIHPNSYFHMLGEGMVTRKLEEYYLAHGLSRGWSTTLALSTMVVSQQLNELLEQQSLARTRVNQSSSRPTIDGADALADSAFWNIVGMVAFQFDGFAELFNNRYLTLAFWPGQPAIDVRSGRLFNQGEMYRTALKLPATDRLKLTWIGGAPIAFAPGLSARIYRDHTLGASYGLFVGATNADELARARTADGTLWSENTTRLDGCLFLHWERNGSLLASLALRGLNGVLFNLYPGAIDLGKWRLGMYVDVRTGDPSAVGLTIGYLPIVPGLQW